VEEEADNGLCWAWMALLRHKQAGTVEDNPECPLEQETFDVLGERSHGGDNAPEDQMELSCLGDSGAECEL
jgi:hypothetical protein